MGQFLHQRYWNFTGPYSSDKVFIQASKYDRTINSANLVLAALFPPDDSQVWNEDLLWQPIAVHPIPKSRDYILHGAACARFVQLRTEFEQSPLIQSMIEQHQDLFDYLELHSGQPIKKIVHLRDLYETLQIEYHSNKMFVNIEVS